MEITGPLTANLCPANKLYIAKLELGGGWGGGDPKLHLKISLYNCNYFFKSPE